MVSSIKIDSLTCKGCDAYTGVGLYLSALQSKPDIGSFPA